MSAYSNPDEQGPPGPPPGPIPLTRTNGPPQTAEERQRAANSRADFRKYGYMPPLITPYNPANPYASNNEVGGRRKKVFFPTQNAKTPLFPTQNTKAPL